MRSASTCLTATTRTTSTITIDCKRNRRPAAVYTQILDELGTFHNTNGKGCDQLPEYMEEELRRERAVAVYFEDSDLMDDVGRIICGIKDAAVNAETPMAAILVSSNDPDGIGDRCRDRLNIVEVEFDRYGHGQLVDILQSRADQAFKTGAVADNVAERIADRVRKLESNCRHGIQPLWRAVQIAEWDGSEVVTVDHVEQAFNPARS